VVAWGLILLFSGLPFVKVGGKPLVLFDIPAREFTLFGATFLPTDGVLLMLLLLAFFLGIFLITALLGRVWCGWGCPQTVYLEFVFRPIEQWLEGSRGQQLKLDRDGPNVRRLLKLLVFAGLAVVVANIFLAYFVGVDRLSLWVTRSPFEHPTPFLVVFAASALVYFDFVYFREQMCTIVCPYARLQSVLLDKNSVVVGYDRSRGEPRSRGRSTGGDCIDCQACVVACPTGIDIRKGLQLECIACAQCVDACDGVMTKIGKPSGLIRYARQRWFAGRATGSWASPRVLMYPVLLVAVLAGLWHFGRDRSDVEVTVLRGIGAPFTLEGESVRNQLRVKLRNRAADAGSFEIALLDVPNALLIAPENPVKLRAGEQSTVGLFVVLPRTAFERGVREIQVRIRDSQGKDHIMPYRLLGPSGPGS
jgi:cytochrome c oxidase accessory protein FixG